jgi:phage tail-like protein
MSRRPDWLLAQLPMGMLDDEFFVRFVSLFQHVASTLLEGADNIDNIVDPTVAPLPVVRWLASWLGVTSIDPTLPEATQRAFVRRAGEILAWRGTRRGLEGFLEAITGGPVNVAETGAVVRDRALGADDEDAQPRQYPRVVDIEVSSLGWLSPADFVELVADEIPASVLWTLRLGGDQLWPPVARVEV